MHREYINDLIVWTSPSKVNRPHILKIQHNRVYIIEFDDVVTRIGHLNGCVGDIVQQVIGY